MNEAAKDLWDQIFARLADSKYAAIVDPDHDDDSDEEGMRIGLAEAGWSDVEIDRRVQAARLDRSGTAVSSPGVAPNIEKQFNRLCDDVEIAMDRIGIDSHVHLARGIEPVTGPGAAMTNVVMTHQGIITVTSFFFRYCGLVARAFTRTLNLDPYIWDSSRYCQKSAMAIIQSDPSLLFYWLSIYLSFAVTGTHIMVPYRPANKQELILFEQVARAMELFALAHEYGHHHHAHGRAIADDPRDHEREADQFALEVCLEIEKRPFLFPNPYLSSGAGGVVLLNGLETLRSVTQLVSGQSEPESRTHPTVPERLALFNTAAVREAKEFSKLKGFRIASQRVMDVAGSIVNEFCQELTPEMISELRAMRCNALPESD